jgi:beta-lactamase class A
VITAVAAVAPVAASRQPSSPTAAAGAPGPTATTPSTDAAADVANGQQQPAADADAALSGDVKQEPAEEENPEVAQKEKVEMMGEVERESQPEGATVGEAQQ